MLRCRVCFHPEFYDVSDRFPPALMPERAHSAAVDCLFKFMDLCSFRDGPLLNRTGAFSAIFASFVPCSPEWASRWRRRPGTPAKASRQLQSEPLCLFSRAIVMRQRFGITDRLGLAVSAGKFAWLGKYDWPLTERLSFPCIT